MNMDTRAVRIPESRIREHYEAAYGLLSHAEVATHRKSNENRLGGSHYISPVLASQTSTTKVKVHFEQALSQVSADDTMLSPVQYKLFYAARRALAVGMTISEFFVEPLGYLDLGQVKKTGALSAQNESRFRALVRSRALVATFIAASHFLQQSGTQASGSQEDTGEWPSHSTHDALAWWVGILADTARKASDDEDLSGRLARAASNVIERMETDAHRLLGEDLSVFVSTGYIVEADEFSVRGFEVSSPLVVKKPLQMSFKKPEEVIGNTIAKSQALKLAKMLVTYDFERQKNPFVELGGFLFTFIGDGFPGTGKTTLIQMIAGLIKDYCEVAGYDFSYENFGIEHISEYQGKSGQHCKAFIERVMNPGSIGFGTLDDIDQVAGKRDDQRASGGQQEVTAILMNAFSGAGTVIRGNCCFGMFSNYPEKVDDALRQRATARWQVDGPQSEADYIDIFALLLGDNHPIHLGAHELYAHQSLSKAVAQSYLKHARPQTPVLETLWNCFIEDQGMPETLRDIGCYLHRVKQQDPRLSGRAIKNITDAIHTRAMDIELPDEWFEDPKRFTAKPWDDKLAMIAELRQPITMPMVIEEMNRYIDSEFRYRDQSDEAAINQLIRDDTIRRTAAQRLSS